MNSNGNCPIREERHRPDSSLPVFRYCMEENMTNSPHDHQNKTSRQKVREAIHADFSAAPFVRVPLEDSKIEDALFRKVPDQISWKKFLGHNGTVDEAWRMKIDRMMTSGSEEIEPELLGIATRISFYAVHEPKYYRASNYVHSIVPFHEKSYALAYGYWNNVDQQVYELKIQLIALCCNQIRRLLDSHDNRIDLASAARLLLETSLRMVSTIFIIRMAHDSVGRTLPIEEYPAHHKELSEFLISSLYPTPVEHNLIKKFIGQESTIGLSWLKKPYEPTTMQQFDVAEFYASKLPKDDTDPGLLHEIRRLRDFYPLLCKLIHPSPLMFREQRRLYELEDEEIDRAIRHVAIRVAASSVKIADLFKSRFHGDLSFLEICESRVALNATKARNISSPKIGDMLDKYKEIKFPTATGEIVVHQLDRIGKEARGMALDFQLLPPEAKQRIKAALQNERNRMVDGTNQNPSN
jgi:hypothetical protein